MIVVLAKGINFEICYEILPWRTGAIMKVAQYLLDIGAVHGALEERVSTRAIGRGM